MAKNKTSTFKNKSLSKQIGLIVGKILLWFVGFTIVWVLAYRFINPPITLLMLQRSAKVERKWVKFEDISDNMKRAAVAAEDQLFLQHIGFDIKAIEKAFENNAKGKKIKGGSTISQQTAKNVFLWPGRSYIRKGFEAYFTLLIEVLWSKERILEVYLNVIEMGDGIYGAEAAAQHYFGKSAKSLSRDQAIFLAAILTNPKYFQEHRNARALKARKQMVQRYMRYAEIP